MAKNVKVIPSPGRVTRMIEEAPDGKVSVAYSRFLGCDKDFAIIPEEAKTVRLIEKRMISGRS